MNRLLFADAVTGPLTIRYDEELVETRRDGSLVEVPRAWMLGASTPDREFSRTEIVEIFGPDWVEGMEQERATYLERTRAMTFFTSLADEDFGEPETYSRLAHDLRCHAREVTPIDVLLILDQAALSIEALLDQIADLREIVDDQAFDLARAREAADFD